MKFAHLADCHLGGWSELKLKDIGINAFVKAIDICIEKKVDFVLISGDLFNTALPSIDILKKATYELKRLKDNDIRCYVIPGSHDYSPSGKTMLDVLENAGLLKNVVKYEEENDKINLKFTKDEETNVFITGLFGKIGSLEKQYYEKLNLDLIENQEGKKIFMFHTALDEFKPRELEMIHSESVNIMPKGFDYYAGGHVHYIFNEDVKGYGKIVFPGALFPNNFGELEKFEYGGVFINTFNDEITSEYIPIKIKDVKKYSIDLSEKDSNQVKDYILSKIDKEDIKDCIVLLRLKGTLSSGRLSEVDFKGLFDELKEAYIVLKNSADLKIKEFEELENISIDSDNIEDSLITKHTDNVELVKLLINVLNKEKLEGEKNLDFESRVFKDGFKVFNIENEN